MTKDALSAIGRFAEAVYEADDVVEVRLLPLRQSTWFKASKLQSQPTWDGQNVYVGANPRKQSGARDAAGVALARCLFVDIDNVTVEEALARLAATALPPPTLTVSSGGGVHFWWRLAEAMTDLAEWTARQKSLIAVIDSDKAIHDPPRIMRLPGTVNVKRGRPCEVVECEPSRRYALDQFPQPHRESVAARIAALGVKSDGVAGLSRATLLFLHAGAAEGERNIRLFGAACDYRGCNIPQARAEADLGAAGARCGMSDDEVTQAIKSAYGKARSPARPASEPEKQTTGDGGEEVASAVRHSLSNVGDDFREIKKRDREGKAVVKTEHVTTYKAIDRIAAEILHAAGGWPKLVGSVPFTVMGEGLDAQPNLLATPSGLFAWLHNVMDVRWRVGDCEDQTTGAARTPPTKSELHDIFKQGGGGIERYRMFTAYPHVPPMRGVFYSTLNLPPPTGARLAEFLAMLNPETDEDRQLMLAALLTPGWGGEPGTRPFFVFTADAGVGAGKTATASALAEIWGGACNLDYEESWADLSKSMMSSDDWNARTLLFDNVKGKYGGSALEALVSAKTLSGWRAYVGKVSRPNDATIYVTFNLPQLTRDMAERSVVIKIGKPKHDKSFVAQASAFIRAHRLELLADLTAILRSPVVEEIEAENGDRWQHWQREVLGRIRGGNALAAMICARRPEVDSDAEDAMSVARAIADKADTKMGEITGHDIRVAARAAGLWKDDPTRPDDKNAQRCVEWARRVLSGRGVIEPVLDAAGRPARRRVYGENGTLLAKSALYRVNRAAVDALDSDGEADEIPI